MQRRVLLVRLLDQDLLEPAQVHQQLNHLFSFFLPLLPLLLLLLILLILFLLLFLLLSPPPFSPLPSIPPSSSSPRPTYVFSSSYLFSLSSCLLLVLLILTLLMSSPRSTYSLSPHVFSSSFYCMSLPPTYLPHAPPSPLHP